MMDNEKGSAALERLEKRTGRNHTLSFMWQRLKGNRWLWGLSAYGPTRSNKTMIADDLMVLNKRVANFGTEISVTKIGHRLANIEVAVLNPKPEIFPLRVGLVTDEREVASCPVVKGGACFESIPFGHYILTFTRRRALVGRYSFQIKETDNGSQ